MSITDFKLQVNAQLARLAQALASAQRLELLDYLAQTERSVETLSQLARLTVANTSRHLQVLRQAALVQVRSLGKQRLYRLAGDDVVQLLTALRHSAELHLAEIERLTQTYLSAKQALEALSAEALLARLARDEVLLLDVRPHVEYAAGHIPGAIQVNPGTVAEALRALVLHEQAASPTAKTVVAYCRGQYCVYAYQAVVALQQQGITALRLAEGLPQWRAAGLPVQTLPPIQPH